MNASYDIIDKSYLGCIMKLRKDAIDLTGKIFGEFIVEHPVQTKGRRGVYWACKCSCGTRTIVPGGHLRAGYRISCGCLSKKDIYVNAIKFLYDSYKRKAKKRKLEFNLELDQFKELILRNCFFCNSEPFQELKSQKTNEIRIKYVGIDRIDNNLGYTIENSVPCCKYCNFAKLNMSLEDFKNHIKRIYTWLLTDF